MGKIYCVMGKSSSGKDSIYQQIMQQRKLPLERIIPYTTRPIREGEEDGREYHFCSEETVQQLENAGAIVELRVYHTESGSTLRWMMVRLIWRITVICIL